jgi:hypothetical protein
MILESLRLDPDKLIFSTSVKASSTIGTTANLQFGE